MQRKKIIERGRKKGGKGIFNTGGFSQKSLNFNLEFFRKKTLNSLHFLYRRYDETRLSIAADVSLCICIMYNM